ncbi:MULTISPECIES: LysR substrate-binding domain-containing protein [unclassified Mesorhizobium]|uniref:LysR substrate-binding domain-containing protein n=1 Tax=unclassified Mesorhizobium TaxID=325217 RepID=UPI00333D40BA
MVADADFVQCWLFPRLPRFERQYPDIRISIHVEIALLRASDDSDCAIVWGQGTWANQRFEPLFANSVFLSPLRVFLRIWVGDLASATCAIDCSSTTGARNGGRRSWRAKGSPKSIPTLDAPTIRPRYVSWQRLD